jgi:pyroglutamyl-peptidase
MHPDRGISLERTAVNLDLAIIPDNEGNQPLGRPVITGAPPTYSSTLPIQAILSALRKEGLPAAVSESAGTYVCNHVFYGLMSRLAQEPSTRGGFVHVPRVPEQAGSVGSVSMPLEEIIRALEIVIETSLTTQEDLQVAGGAS